MPKRVLSGTVIADKNDKTVVVRVERAYTHPVLKKTVRTSKKYYAHDADNKHKVGDTVLFSKYSGNDIKLDGDDHLIIREDDILAVIEK